MRVVEAARLIGALAVWPVVSTGWVAGAEVAGVVRPTSQTSRITTLTAAAIGSAISAPSSPASLAPTSRVTITVGADKSIALVMILGRMK